MKLLRLLPAAPALILLASAAPSQEFANIGKLKAGKDSPLVKGEYPRLMITRAQIPAIRERMKHPEMQKYLAQARDFAKTGKADKLLLAAMYQVTGDAQYADMAKKKLGSPSWDPAWTFSFDMVAETMTDAERRDYAGKILAQIKANRWRPRLLHCLAAWGNGLDGEITPFLESSHAKEVERTLARNNGWSQGRGGSSMGHGYNGEHFFSAEWAAIMGWSQATGEDLIAKSDFVHNTPAWYIYHYLPWDESWRVKRTWEKTRRVIRIGVTSMPAHAEALTPRKHQAESYVMLDITRTRNGRGQLWHREFIGKWQIEKWHKPEAAHRVGLAGRLLWLDPKIPSVPPEKFPETRLFPVNGHVVMRSDWTVDATVALFRCGRYGTIDGHGGRNNLDNLQFLIYRGGYLAPPTGCKHSLNEKAWKMGLKPGFDNGGENLFRYGKHTIAQNSITVGREPIVFKNSRGKLIDVIPRGGQSQMRKPDWLQAWGLADGKGFRPGRITAYSTSPAYDYSCGDASYSYPPERVRKITRQFVYIKPDTFVVFDRVTPAKPGLEVIWNLHAYRKPGWNGKTAPAKMPEGHRPGGHFDHTEGDAFSIEYGGGAMEVTTLLPAAADRLVRTIGGPWHDFEINGVNIGPTDATYEVLKNKWHKGDGGLEGVGGWRIEISPKKVAGEVHYLHVLQTGAAGALKPGEVSLVKAGGRAGAKIVLGPKAYEVTFSTAGPTGGKIRMTDGGKAVVDEALVTKVEDNYDRWNADPRYKEWMTNEYMRTVIFPYGKRPEGAGTRTPRPGRTVAAKAAPTGRGAAASNAKAARLYRDAKTAERAGMKDLARSLYARIAKDHPGTPEAVKAAAAAKRLK